ncbi:hypothetical protein D3C78_1296270 [compost metagenome]
MTTRTPRHHAMVDFPQHQERKWCVLEEDHEKVEQERDQLKVENERLYDLIRYEEARFRRALDESERLRGIKAEPPPRPPEGEGLPRYGLRWNGPSQPVCFPFEDGYWTPWHLAQAEIEALRKDKDRLDSGCIMTHERDEFGQAYKSERRGLDLRAAIDDAIHARQSQEVES